MDTHEIYDITGSSITYERHYVYYAFANIKVLSLDFKLPTVLQYCTCSGNLFHRVGAALLLKLLSTYVAMLIFEQDLDDMSIESRV